MFSSKNGVPRMLYLISTTAKGFKKYLDLVSYDEKQVTEKCHLIGTSDCFTKVNVFVVCG